MDNNDNIMIHNVSIVDVYLWLIHLFMTIKINMEKRCILARNELKNYDHCTNSCCRVQYDNVTANLIAYLTFGFQSERLFWTRRLNAVRGAEIFQFKGQRKKVKRYLFNLPSNCNQVTKINTNRS